ncbi:MAG: hypothetical protein ABJ004_18935 [Cyclobacteriaceae bacterium]
MSSHHIVRDEQEPALLLTALESSQWPVILQLFGWSPTVLAAESVLDQISSLGHKVDIALVSVDQVNYWKEQLTYQNPVDIRPVRENLIFDAASTAISGKYRAINVVTDDAGLPNVIAQCQLHFPNLDVVIYSETQRHIIVKNHTFQKWLADFSRLSVMPMRENTFISTEGFDLDMGEEKLADGITLTKKREGQISIRINHGPILISEEIT